MVGGNIIRVMPLGMFLRVRLVVALGLTGNAATIASPPQPSPDDAVQRPSRPDDAGIDHGAAAEADPALRPLASPPAARTGGDADQASSVGRVDPESATSNAVVGRSKWPHRLGPATVDIGKSGDQLTFGFAVQLRGFVEQDWSQPSTTADGGIAIQRLRTVLKGRFLDGKIRSSLQFNLTPASPELLDVWFMVVPIDKLAARVGQFKIPYTRYRAQSFAALSLVDWSPTTGMFGAERQLGLEFLNPASDSVWEYGLGIFTGVNARASHGADIAAVYGETPVNRSDLRSFEPGLLRAHPELVGRVSRNFGPIDTSSNTDAAGGPFRTSVGLSGASDLQAVEREDLSTRFAVEWLAKVHHAHINLVGHMGWFDTARDLGPWGALAEAGYRFNRRWELVGRYSGIWLGGRLKSSASDYAARVTAPIDVDPETLERYELVGRVRSRHESAVAVSYYIVGHSLKAQLEGLWRGEDTEGGWQHAGLARLQLQFQF